MKILHIDCFDELSHVASLRAFFTQYSSILMDWQKKN